MVEQRYERVFAALDGSADQQAVARRAVQIAHSHHACLMLGHVVETVPAELTAIDFGDLCAVFRTKVEESLGSILDDVRADENIPDVQVRVVAGWVNETLTSRLIEPYDPDLIVCGERGLTNLQYAFTTSTSKHLIRTQDRDVLVVKQ